MASQAFWDVIATPSRESQESQSDCFRCSQMQDDNDDLARSVPNRGRTLSQQVKTSGFTAIPRQNKTRHN